MFRRARESIILIPPEKLTHRRDHELQHACKRRILQRRYYGWFFFFIHRESSFFFESIDFVTLRSRFRIRIFTMREGDTFIGYEKESSA